MWWDVCSLLAHNGKPDKLQYDVYSRTMSWWYRARYIGDYELKLVTLELEDGVWMTTFVAW